MFLREEEQRAERNLPPNKSPDKTEGYYAEKKCFKKSKRFFLRNVLTAEQQRPECRREF